MKNNKLLTEELSRIKQVMFPGLITEANILGNLAKGALDDAVKRGIKNVIDDLFKTGARETIERMAVKGADAIPPGQLINKIYDDVAVRAFGKSYNGLSVAEKSLVKNTVATSLEESDQFLKQSARSSMDDAGKKAIGATDNAGKKTVDPDDFVVIRDKSGKNLLAPSDDLAKKGVGATDDAGSRTIKTNTVNGPGKTKVKSKTPRKAKGNTKKVTTAAKEGTPESSWGRMVSGFQKGSKTKWGRRILWGAAGLGAAYLLWLSFWGDDDDIPPCLKALVDSEQKFESYLANGYVVFGNYKFYPENKVELASADGMVREGEWSYDESAQQIELEFGDITHSIDCPASLIEPLPEDEDEDEDGTGGGGTGGGGSYKNCTDFPFIKFCKNTKIAEVQKCLGGLVADGKFGPKTEDALESAGYGTDISEDDYTKIIQKCKGVQPSPETPYQVNPSIQAATEID